MSMDDIFGKKEGLDLNHFRNTENKKDSPKSLEELLAMEETYSIEDFKYLVSASRSNENNITKNTIEVYVKRIRPEFEKESKNKIEVLKSYIGREDYKAVADLYNSSLDYFLEKDSSVAKFNVIFGFLMLKAAE